MPTLSNTHTRRLELAARLSLRSACKHRHGALIVRGGRVLARGVNTDRGLYSNHAESAAMRGVDVTGATVYIARTNKAGDTLLSRPCAECMRELRAAGVRAVVYTPGVMERL